MSRNFTPSQIMQQNLIRLCPVVLALLLVVGCQSQSDLSARQLTFPQPLYDQHFVQTGPQIESEAQIFALSAQDVAQVRQAVLPFQSARDRSLALLHFIFNDGRDPLEYVNSATLTASQTLQQRQANCMSLTVLAYSLAQALGFQAYFQDVEIPEYWVTRDGNSMLNGHVNLVVEPTSRGGAFNAVSYGPTSFLIDFDRRSNKTRLPVQKIDRVDIVAMFYNNKAAEAIVDKEYDLAYRYLKAAIELVPASAQSWNNLAVLYRHKQLLAEAEQSYLYSLQLAPEHANTMANLAYLYGLTGREMQAQQLLAKVERKRQSNPYYFILLGNEALAHNLADDALSAFKQSLKLQPDIPEAYFGLAKSYILLGDTAAAARYLLAAKKYSVDHSEQRRYQQKIDMLNAVAKLR